jgi:signal transduction histidine kinase
VITATLLQLEELSAVGIEAVADTLEELQTTRTVVTDDHGYALYDSLKVGNAKSKLLMFPEVIHALRGYDVFYCYYEGEAMESRLAVPLMRGGQTLGVVYFMEYSTEQGSLIQALRTNILRISIVLEAGIVLAALFFSTAFSRRLRRILVSVRHMRDGDYSQQIRLGGRDELTHLGQEFNELADRLKSSEERRRQFVSDASHELKTPLATIKLLSDSILQNEMDPETEREFIGDIGREADRLGRLTQKLLALTKLDSSVSQEMEILDGKTIVIKVARMLRPLAKLRGIRLDCTCEEDCSLMMVEDDLYQIVFNLTENAIKYNRDRGWVGLHLYREGEEILLTVGDSGVGIPEEARSRIFDRFYRVDKARSRAAGGSGLGLSIVHDMVKRNDGSITVAPREGGGTVFTIRFPVFDMEEGQ